MSETDQSTRSYLSSQYDLFLPDQRLQPAMPPLLDIAQVSGRRSVLSFACPGPVPVYSRAGKAARTIVSEIHRRGAAHSSADNGIAGPRSDRKFASQRGNKRSRLYA